MRQISPMLNTVWICKHILFQCLLARERVLLESKPLPCLAIRSEMDATYAAEVNCILLLQTTLQRFCCEGKCSSDSQWCKEPVLEIKVVVFALHCRCVKALMRLETFRSMTNSLDETWDWSVPPPELWLIVVCFSSWSRVGVFREELLMLSFGSVENSERMFCIFYLFRRRERWIIFVAADKALFGCCSAPFYTRLDG